MNFHPPLPPLFLSPLLCFFLIPQILIGSITLLQKFTPHFKILDPRLARSVISLVEVDYYFWFCRTHFLIIRREWRLSRSFHSRRGSRGGEMGEFPTPSFFSEPYSFLFFLSLKY